jgi:hypothetical protein
MSIRRIFSLALCIALCAGTLAALSFLAGKAARAQVTTRYVATSGMDSGDCTDPENPCRTVQQGVDVAGEGDVVKIATGVYTDVNNRADLLQTVYISKSVSLVGGYTMADWTAPDPQANPTTLDAEGRGRVVYITGDITVTIWGLRITGGDAEVTNKMFEAAHGAGLYVVSATLTLSNSQVIDNGFMGYGEGCGGGLFLLRSDATLAGNTISRNWVSEAAFGSGGGLCAYKGDIVLDGNTISDNTAAGTCGSGGGLALRECQARLIENTISDNYAGGPYGSDGGGVVADKCDITLIGNTVSNNQARSQRGSDGGGLYLSSGTATLVGNTIVGNVVQKYTMFGSGADGLDFWDCTASLINNVIAENGEIGLRVGCPLLDLRHTTLAGNSLRVAPGSLVTMSNTIVVSATEGVYVNPGGTLRMEATLWGTGRWANDADWGGSGTIITGTHNRWGDPVFVAPGIGDYHLGAGSAAIDWGIDAGIGTDIDGEARPEGCGFDIGADEFFTGVECRRVRLPLMLRSRR